MNRLAAGLLAAPLALQALAGGVQTGAFAAAGHPSACTPSPTVLHAAVAPVAGLTPEQAQNATAIINAAAQLHVPERGQTIAVMTALEASALSTAPSDQGQGAGTSGLFGQAGDPKAPPNPDPTASAQAFYRALTQVKDWVNLPPTLAAHAAQRNLDPEAYTRWWPEAVRVVDALTTGTGAAGLQNLAARAQAVADCTAATVRGEFAINDATRHVGPFTPTVLDSRAVEFARHGGNGWFDRCQAFVAILDGRPYSGYSTALDAWQTFEAAGVAHPVTSPDGVSPPVGAWLYYRDATNPAGHVVAYLGNGQIVSTDVFGRGRVGIGPASAITDGPWRMQYLGWAPPWGNQ